MLVVIRKGISVGKTVGCMGKAGESGVKCGGFYVNEYKGGFYFGVFDSVCRSMTRGNNGRKMLGLISCLVFNAVYLCLRRVLRRSGVKV